MAQMAETFLQSKLARAGFLILLAISVANAVFGHPLVAAAAAAGAGVTMCDPVFHPRRKQRPWPGIQRLFFVILTLLVLASLHFGPLALSHWLYVLPLVAFARFPATIAAALSLAICLLTLAFFQWAGPLPERHQITSAFVLTLLLSGLLVFLRAYKSRQLAPLRRTDELTQAASREYLSADLHREIQRSEREGTDMSVLMIGLDAHLCNEAADEDIRSILPAIGRFLNSQLRDFDTYYRVADFQFLAILPGVSTSEAVSRAEAIRSGLKALLQSHGLNLTVSAGVAGLNIGDDADSLQQSAANALRRAQQQGGDRTQSYHAWSHSPRDIQGQEASAS